jgi:hypothetical protein
MTEDDNTKDLTGELTDRQLLELIRREFNERLERLEARVYDTNQLPPNFAARFAALESLVREMGLELRGVREDLERERKIRFGIEDRLAALESRPN